MSLAQKSFVTAAVAPFLLAFGLAAANAESSEPFCLPAAQMKAHLNNAGQFSLVAFEQQGSDPSKYGFIAYYSTKDGSHATEVQGIEPRNSRIPKGQLQIPAQLCKVDDFTDVKLVLNESKTIPTSFYEKDMSEKNAMLVCEKRQWGACGPFNRALYLGAKNQNVYPMLRLTSAEFNPDGSVAKRYGTLTVSANPDPNSDMGGDVMLSTGGVGTIKYDITHAIYTKDGIAALTQRWPIVVATEERPVCQCVGY